MVWRGTLGLSFEGELRAIARYGSTAYINDATNSGQGTDK